MDYVETKVYFDGSHYIAIPHTTNPKKKKNKKAEDKPTVVDEQTGEVIIQDNGYDDIESASEVVSIETPTKQSTSSNTTGMTLLDKKNLFNIFYKETLYMGKWERKHYLIQLMMPYFNNETATRYFVQENIERKERNMACRRIRLSRKINLQEFNYFCTFTYDDKKHDEESFRKKLKDTFKKMCYRRHWKYIGVWERSPEKDRLHFHGLFFIPKDQMVGELVEVMDYSPVKKKVQRTIQNTYFNERFGRSDFSEILHRQDLGEAMTYLIKYIEKTGEKIVYSKGLPQFFISDIAEEDIVCKIGAEDKKLLLFDDFMCYDYGCLMGNVSKETIKQMRKVN